MSKDKRHVFRLPPCPDYDVEGMESWLGDMAASGLVLSCDGFFAGLAIFERSKPCTLRYRFDAAPKKTGLFSESNGPDEEACALAASCGWDFVTSHGQFMIYRTADPEARELHTDPQIQALAINQIRRRERGSVAACFFWSFLYPLLWMRGEWLLTMFRIGTGFILFGAALVLCLFAGTAARAIHFRRLRQKLARGEALDHRKAWRTRAVRHRVFSLLLIICCLVWLGNFLRLWGSDITDAGKIPLDTYSGNPPFATIADLAPGGSYKLDDFGVSNTVEIRKDWLSPSVILWAEIATAALPDGKTVSGGLYVDYYETLSPWLAHEAAREYLYTARRSKFYEELSLPSLTVDYAAGYCSSLHFPVLLLQKGNILIKAEFYQTSQDYQISLEEWAVIMADSIS